MASSTPHASNRSLLATHTPPPNNPAPIPLDRYHLFWQQAPSFSNPQNQGRDTGNESTTDLVLVFGRLDYGSMGQTQLAPCPADAPPPPTALNFFGGVCVGWRLRLDACGVAEAMMLAPDFYCRVPPQFRFPICVIGKAPRGGNLCILIAVIPCGGGLYCRAMPWPKWPK